MVNRLRRAKIPQEFHLSSVVAFREGDMRKPRISQGFLYMLDMLATC